MKTINAKGNVCLEPVTMIKAEVDRGEEELEILMDDPVSASNVMRFLGSNGFGVQVKDDEGAITISARKGEHSHKTPKAATFKQPVGPAQDARAASGPQTTPTYPKPSGTYSVLITGEILGYSSRDRENQELGEVLMKSFLGALPQIQNPPLVVALINEGVKLALYDSSYCDHLKNLEKKGASILICGTSANYFNIMDQIGVGSVSNMLEIIETLNKADKVATL